MKFRLFFVWGVLFILICNPAYSQWAIGGKSGIHISEQRIFLDKEYEFSSPKNYGLEVGGLIERKFKNGLVLGGEILYIEKGTKSPFYIEKLNVVETSLHLKYRYDLSKFNLWGGVGGFAGYIMSGRVKNPEDEESFRTFVLTNEGINREDLGLSLSSGVGYEIGRGYFFLESKYRHSLTAFAEDQLSQKILKVKHTGFSFYLGYLWTIGQKKK